MQIMIYWDSMLYLRNIQLYHLLVILVHTLLTLDQYIHPPPIQVELHQNLLTSTTGMAHLCLVTCQPRTHFLLWIFIITVGNTIPLLSLLLQAVVWLLLISPQCHLVVKGQSGVAQMYQDQDLLCIPSLLVTGTSLESMYRIKIHLFAQASELLKCNLIGPNHDIYYQ